MKYSIVSTALALAIAAPSHAAVFVSQTADITATSAPATQAVQFNAFDTLLGTLTSVMLSFSSSLNATGSAANTSNASHTYTLTKSASASLSGNGFNISETLASGSVALGSIGAHSSLTLTPITGSGSDNATLLTGLSAFTGSSPVVFTFASLNGFSLSNPGNLTVNAAIGGSATLAYYYTPTVVSSPAPEPATWALMVSGFGLLGFTMRRRRQAVVTFA